MLEPFQIFKFRYRIWKWLIKQRDKNRKTIDEIKKYLNKSLVNGQKHENNETGERARMIEKPEDVAAIIRQCEHIIRSKQ